MNTMQWLTKNGLALYSTRHGLNEPLPFGGGVFIIIRIEPFVALTETVSSTDSRLEATLTTSSESQTHVTNFEVLQIQQTENISALMSNAEFRQELTIMGATHIELFVGLGKLPECARSLICKELLQSLAQTPLQTLAMSA